MDQSNSDWELKKTVSKMAWTYFTTMAITLLIQVVLKFVCMKFFPSFYRGNSFIWLASVIPLYCFGFPTAWLMFKKIPDHNEPTEMSFMPVKKFVKLFLIGYAFLYLGNIISLALSSLITLLTGKEILNPVNSAIQNSNIVITFISTIIIAPLGEEFFFRYLPYKKLSRFGDKIYILTTALFFGLFHMNIFQILYAFLLGTILAYMYANTHNMVYNISLHMIINFIGGVLGLIIGDNETALTIFGMVILLFVVSGFILYIKNRKNTVFNVSEYTLIKPFKNILLNTGMLSFILLFVVDFIMSIILS